MFDHFLKLLKSPLKESVGLDVKELKISKGECGICSSLSCKNNQF
jgi:hypothetical protein